MPLHRGFVLPDAFGNALGNSIVSNRINAEQTKRNAMLASDALSQQTNGRLNQQLDAELQQRAGAIANDIGTRSAADGAAGFDANLLAQLNVSDLIMDQYLNKQAGAIDGYLNMSRKTQRDIQSIDARAATSRQQLATQAAQIQQRYDQRTMDFRMANPMYRAPEGFSQFNRDAASFIEFRKNQKIQLIDELNLSPDAMDGSWADLALWSGAAVINESWQGAQFLGKSVLNGLTLGFYNDELSPLSSGYHSLIGENKLFGKPTTIAGAIGYEAGEVGSYLIDPLAAVGVVGKLSKFDLPSYVFVGQDVNSSFGQAGALINGKLVRTVPTDVSASFQGMKYLDPRTNTFQFGTFDETMAVDHIVPVKSIQKMPGFNKLTIKQQIAIIQDQVGIGNFQPLTKSLNSSKGSKSFDTSKQWYMYKDIKLDSVYVNNLHNTQEEIALAIRAKISEFQKLNNQGNK